MLLNRLAYRIPLIPRICIRMTSTIVGKSGRVYAQREVLADRKDPRLSVFKAEYAIKRSPIEFILTEVVLDPMASLLFP